MADEQPIFRTQDTPDSTRLKLNKLARSVAGLEDGVPSDLAATLEDFEQRIADLESAAG